MLLQRDNGEIGWAFQETGCMLMNDYRGQHMVFSPDCYVAVAIVWGVVYFSSLLSGIVRHL